MRHMTIGAVLLVAFAAVDATGQGNVEGDRAALEALYHATDGPNWRRNCNWTMGGRLRDWCGVQTISSFGPDDGRVRRLLLADNNMSGGPIPPELGQLTYLQSLDLKGNHLNGHVPPELVELGRLATQLFSIELGDNNLSGPIPPELGRLNKSLRILSLSGNNFTGPIPPELGNLDRVTSLTIDADTGLCLPPLHTLTRGSRFWTEARRQGVPICDEDTEPLWCPVTPQSSCQVNAPNGSEAQFRMATGDTCKTCPPECQEARVEAEKLIAGIPFGEVGLRILCKLLPGRCPSDVLREYERILAGCLGSAGVGIGVRGLTGAGALEGWDIEMESSDPSVLQVVEDAESITLVKHKAGPVALRITGTNSSEGVVARVSHHLMIGSTAVPALTGVALPLLFVALATAGAVRLRRRRGAS